MQTEPLCTFCLDDEYERNGGNWKTRQAQLKLEGGWVTGSQKHRFATTNTATGQPNAVAFIAHGTFDGYRDAPYGQL